MVKKDVITKDKQIEHLKNERRILALIKDCDFIINFYDTFQDESYLYYAMEYAWGGELTTLFKKYWLKLTSDDCQIYLAEILIAIEFLHNQNIVYRDLKPENIVIDYHGHIKLIDFGFAKQLIDSEDRAYTPCGTKGYIAPEILNGYGHHLSADIWSFGALISSKASFPPLSSFLNSESGGGSKFQGPSDSISNMKDLKDLVKWCMHEHAHSRPTIKEVMDHKYFENIDWQMVREKK